MPDARGLRARAALGARRPRGAGARGGASRGAGARAETGAAPGQQRGSSRRQTWTARSTGFRRHSRHPIFPLPLRQLLHRCQSPSFDKAIVATCQFWPVGKRTRVAKLHFEDKTPVQLLPLRSLLPCTSCQTAIFDAIRSRARQNWALGKRQKAKGALAKPQSAHETRSASPTNSAAQPALVSPTREPRLAYEADSPNALQSFFCFSG